MKYEFVFFFSSRRRHTRYWRDWSSDVCSSDLTFLTTLFLPIQVAVGIGVVLSAVLYLYTSSADVSVIELVERPDGRIEERKPPKQLRSHAVTVLDVYGHLFYAGARTLERLLPRTDGAERPVVILRLRGRASVGATLIDVLAAYDDKLRAVGGRLYLAEVSEGAYDQIARTGKLGTKDGVRAYKATRIVGEATHAAHADAAAWLAGQNGTEEAG